MSVFSTDQLKLVNPYLACLGDALLPKNSKLLRYEDARGHCGSRGLIRPNLTSIDFVAWKNKLQKKFAVVWTGYQGSELNIISKQHEMNGNKCSEIKAFEQKTIQEV